uniref:RNA polymerase sigma-70 factor n=1 Tax=Roseihalotalea indica TaxID=2867963 RepID=A0AA49JDZ6_9BACT|nr:RNA polymerase sigma-70 factor [Tunicatimonas sp. TK19036]
MRKNYQENEREIIVKVTKGDHQAFRQVYDQYKDVLYGYSYKLTKSAEMAEEAVQETFMKVWQNRAHLDADLSIRAYLYKITQNHIFNTLRNAAYSDKLKQEVFYSRINTHFSTEDQVVYHDLEGFKEKAIASLPARRQLIFQMSRSQGLSHEEIASQLGISQHTVKDQIVKALKSIKKYLQVYTDIALGLVLYLF